PVGAALPAPPRRRPARCAQAGERVTATVVLGPLRESDAPRCAELERLLFAGDDPWSAQSFREELRAGYHYVAARVDDTLVGYAGLRVVGHEAGVPTLGGDPAHQ